MERWANPVVKMFLPFIIDLIDKERGKVSISVLAPSPRFKLLIFRICVGDFECIPLSSLFLLLEITMGVLVDKRPTLPRSLSFFPQGDWNIL